jgi:hypothetical protein
MGKEAGRKAAENLSKFLRKEMGAEEYERRRAIFERSPLFVYTMTDDAVLGREARLALVEKTLQKSLEAFEKETGAELTPDYFLPATLAGINMGIIRENADSEKIQTAAAMAFLIGFELNDIETAQYVSPMLLRGIDQTLRVINSEFFKLPHGKELAGAYFSGIALAGVARKAALED